MANAKLVLEIAPPLLSSGRGGLDEAVAYIRRAQAGLGLEAVNIPEIHTEKHRTGSAHPLTPCEARVPIREFAAHISDACAVPCILNHVVAYQPAQQLEQWLEESWCQFGIRHFILVGGESSTIQYPGPSVTEANRIARRLFAGREARIGNICIPSRANEAQRVRAKIASGVDFFSTQIVYQLDELLALSRQLQDAAVDTSNSLFYLSFCPVQSACSIRFLQRLGVTLTPAVVDELLCDRADTLERSKAHIADLWRQFHQHIQHRHPPLPLAINLSPIGKIDCADTIDLGNRLLQTGKGDGGIIF
ncbi:hypothetical protein G8764_02965 [Pseudomaricurvus alcaniphilus]|uniref:methylenetetrahydrofolate reductase n=1 Tax=Pseudomaricurvus alcaniphilus TaxID=1166482 RepID=UPI0014092BFE|nr:methylenetetrahydrofolate reductase [Pseudomaricurvus alcaniphilus]NHN36250.1 hypothetical protein [Pseudomaricurvus alcaniphilus]